MRKHIYLLFFFFGLFNYPLSVSAAEHGVCVLDSFNTNQLPENYRSTKQIKSPIGPSISTIGLSALNESGSAQFSAKQLKQLIQLFSSRQTIIDVDLRQESHGFLNGYAISSREINNWGNLGKTNQQIKTSEVQFLNNVKNFKILKVADVGSVHRDEKKPRSFLFLKVKSTFTEKQLTQAYGIGYKRLYVTDRCRPTDQQADEFIRFVKTLPPHTWVHFHCLAGKGRTTTFMAMYDMIHNAKQVSFNDILARQAALGGINLAKLSATTKFYASASKRLLFLKCFYVYCRFNQDNFATTWTQWLNSM